MNMIYYKNIFLNISNSLNSRKVSKQYNPYSDMDAKCLAYGCQFVQSVIARNGKKYYYFVDHSLGSDIIQYLLNSNGVLAYRRYSGYQVFYSGLRKVVRVPVDYVLSNPNAKVFIDKVIEAQLNDRMLVGVDMTKYIDSVHNRMRQK